MTSERVAQSEIRVVRPPEAIHQEINLDEDAPIEMIVSRVAQENIVVNVDLPEA